MNLKLDLKGEAKTVNIFEWDNFETREIFIFPAMPSSRNINLSNVCYFEELHEK